MEKALFWDFDGTLVYNSSDIWEKSLYSILKKLKYNVEIKKIYQHLSGKSTEQIKVAFSWHTPENSYTDSTNQKWWDNFLKQLEPFYNHYMISREDAEKANSYIKDSVLCCSNYNLYEDAVVVLRKCMEMGYNNYILSNNYPELPLVIKALGLSEYFVDYAVSANIGYEKPRIEIFQYALKIANFPDVCYMIGDNPIADIQGGKSAGMKTVLVHKKSVFEADYLCKNLSKIPAILL